LARVEIKLTHCLFPGIKGAVLVDEAGVDPPGNGIADGGLEVGFVERIGHGAF